MKSSKWTKEGTQILKNGTPVFLNGVCYSPTPCGAATYTPGVGDWFATPWNAIWERDFPLMKAAGIDNIRTYFFWAWTPPANIKKWKEVTSEKPAFDHSEFLKLAHKYGISVTIGVALDGGNIFDNPSASAREDYLSFYKATAEKLAELYGDNPAVMGFCIGNEQNNPSRIITAAFWDGLDYIAKAVRAKAPDKLVMLAMQNDNPNMYKAQVNKTDSDSPFAGKSVPYCFANIFDVWGVNIYSGMDVSLNDYKKHVADTENKLPLIVSEWGVSAANMEHAPLTSKEFQTSITKTMNPQGKVMGDHVSFVAGAQFFEWTDEWWKGNNPKPWEHTLPESNEWPEQWWGLHGIAPVGRTAKDGPWNPKKQKPYPSDTLTERPTLEALKECYAKINPELIS